MAMEIVDLPTKNCDFLQPCKRLPGPKAAVFGGDQSPGKIDDHSGTSSHFTRVEN